MACLVTAASPAALVSLLLLLLLLLLGIPACPRPIAGGNLSHEESLAKCVGYHLLRENSTLEHAALGLHRVLRKRSLLETWGPCHHELDGSGLVLLMMLRMPLEASRVWMRNTCGSLLVVVVVMQLLLKLLLLPRQALVARGWILRLRLME